LLFYNIKPKAKAEKQIKKISKRAFISLLKKPIIPRSL